MKRCPLCDFIYEDDQGQCDMDGIELVPNQGTALIRLEAAAQPAESRRRRFAALPVAGIILVIFLFTAYYISAGRAAPQEADRPPVKVAADSPAQSPVADVKAADERGGDPPASPQPAPSPQPSPREEEKRPKRRGEKRSEPGKANEKKESDLGSILKKTGRVLKKPFKL